MELVAIVTGLSILQAFYFSVCVGQARVAHGINAPLTSGNDEFERAFRVHANTIEQLVIFLPGIWMFGYYVDWRISAGIGVLFIIGRFIYRSAYIGDPKGRTLGFATGALSMMVLVLGGLIGAAMKLM